MILILSALFYVAESTCNHHHNPQTHAVYRQEPNQQYQYGQEILSYRPVRTQHFLQYEKSGPPQQLLVPKVRKLDEKSNVAEFKGVWETKFEEETLWGDKKVAKVKKYQTKGAFEGKINSRTSDFLTKLIRGRQNPRELYQQQPRIQGLSSYSSPPIIRLRRQAGPPPSPNGMNDTFNSNKVVQSIPGMAQDPKGVSEKIKEAWLNFKQEAAKQFDTLKTRVQEGAAKIKSMIESSKGDKSADTKAASPTATPKG